LDSTLVGAFWMPLIVGNCSKIAVAIARLMPGMVHLRRPHDNRSDCDHGWGVRRGDTHSIARRVTCLTALNLSCTGFILGARRFTGGGGLALTIFLTGGGGSASSHELESSSLATTAIVEPHTVQ
jgi:hypothetical protein